MRRADTAITWAIFLALVLMLASCTMVIDHVIQRNCTSYGQALGASYAYDGLLYGCEVEISGHWWRISGLDPAPAPQEKK